MIGRRKNHKRFVPSLMALVSISAACSDGMGSRARIRSLGFFSQADLGTPVGGVADAAAPLEPLIQDSGLALIGETQTATELITHVEKGESYLLSAKSRVKIIAENGDWLRVLAQVQAEGHSFVEEGFVASKHVRILGSESEGFTANLLDNFPIVENIIDEKNAEGEIQSTLSTSENEAGNSQGANEDPIILASAEGASPMAGANGTADQAGMGAGDGAAEYKEEAGTVTASLESNVGPETSQAVPEPPPVPTQEPYPAPPQKELKAKCDDIIFVLKRKKGDMKCKDNKESSSCTIAGELLREADKLKDREAFFEVKGRASKWKVDVSSDDAKNKKGKKVSEHLVKMDQFDSWSDDGKTVIPLRDIMKSNGIRGGIRTFEFTPVAQNGDKGKSCKLHMRAISPIVLDLGQQGLLEGPALGETAVRFDLLGNGIKAQTGWVSPRMGFLALDRDGDGQISSGRELFGDGTRGPSGEFFSNGYEALARHDGDGDGLITQKDEVFSQLLVWQDLNQNGLSEAQELRTLASYRITALSVVYGPSLRHGPATPDGHDVRWEARYFGPPSCGEEGCLSFDVYFETAQSLAAK